LHKESLIDILRFGYYLKMNNIVLAFDIERSGARCEHHTIGIGASVVDSDFKELDRLFLPGYIQSETIFEDRCFDEFWSKFPDKLEELAYEGDLNMEERQKEMITEFQAFRAKWEKYAKDNKVTIEVVADNNVYDGGFINEMIFQHTDSLPLPYNTEQKYKSFWETHSEQRGFLMGIDPEFKGSWGLSKRISELYEIPEMTNDHDHNPANDAYTIAFEHQVMIAIRDGRISKRKKSWSPRNVDFWKIGKWGSVIVGALGVLSLGSRGFRNRQQS
jgi:hypothetical protein